MRIVWALTVLHLVAGHTGVEASSTRAVQPESVSGSPQYEQITIGFYESKAACSRMLIQLAHAPGIKAGSAQCRKELN